jgi:transposase
MIDVLTEQIAEADRELAATAKADPVARWLMTAPGVGPATAVGFVAALDEISRFTGAHAVGSYLGLVAGEDSSAERGDEPALRKPVRRSRIADLPSSTRWSLATPTKSHLLHTSRQTHRRHP